MDLLNNMRVFVRVVDCASFTAAADALDLSTAQVSRLVADLEQHVQARLLQRTTRRLSLTEAGERFLLRSRQILEEMEEATAEARGAHLKPSGRLRVHSMNGLGVLGWGVGGIEAEAVMLGQPLYMLMPEVVGFKLTGQLSPGATATRMLFSWASSFRAWVVPEFSRAR